MTQEEINVLKGMTQSEIAWMYAKRLIRKEITMAQYNLLISIGRELEKKSQLSIDDITSTFGGEEIKEDN